MDDNRCDQSTEQDDSRINQALPVVVKTDEGFLQGSPIQVS
jgi:hypothetical protein